MSQDEEEKSVLGSKYYFKLGHAVDDVSLAYGAKDTTVAGAKLVGKTLFNTTLFAGKLGAAILKELPNAMAKQAKRSKK